LVLDPQSATWISADLVFSGREIRIA